MFDRVQQVKASHNKKRFKYAGLPYIYRGLVRCKHCDCAITPEKHKGHVYYHCTQYRGKHGAQWLREEEITEQLGAVFKKMVVPRNELNRIINNLKNVHEGKTEFRELQAKKLTQEHEKYAKMTEALYMDKLQERITDNEYDKYYQSFRDKINELDTKLALLQEAEDNYYITAKYVLEIASRAYELFISSEVEEKRQLLRMALQNLQLDGNNLVYTVIKPFDSIVLANDSQLWLPGSDSNRQPNGYM
jgi:site-specific DNA recombinase